MQESLWARFDYYSKRVHEIVNGGDRLYYRMAHLRPNTLCLPALRSLVLGSATYRRRLKETEKDMDSLVFPVSLRDFSLIVESQLSGMPVGNYLKSLSTEAPGLQKLFVYGAILDTSLNDLSTFGRLSSLDLLSAIILHRGSLSSDTRSATFDFLRSLSQLDSLEHLALPTEGLTDDAIPRCNGFQGLRSLTVLQEPPIAMAVTEMIASGHLREIRFTGNAGGVSEPAGTLSDWHRYFEVMAERYASSLRSIYLYGAIDGDNMKLMDFIEPLLSLHQIQDVSLKFEETHTITSANMHKIAFSWPRLRTYFIESRVTDTQSSPSIMSVEPSGSAFNCLGSFAALCPELTSLKLCIADDLADSSEYPQFNHGLKKLVLSVPGVEDPVETAHIIYHAFPNVVDILVSAEGHDYDRWQAVYSIISKLQQVRKLGRDEGRMESRSH